MTLFYFYIYLHSGVFKDLLFLFRSLSFWWFFKWWHFKKISQSCVWTKRFEEWQKVETKPCWPSFWKPLDWRCSDDHDDSLFSLQSVPWGFWDMSGTPTWLTKANYCIAWLHDVYYDYKVLKKSENLTRIIVGCTRFLFLVHLYWCHILCYGEQRPSQTTVWLL